MAQKKMLKNFTYILGRMSWFSTDKNEDNLSVNWTPTGWDIWVKYRENIKLISNDML